MADRPSRWTTFAIACSLFGRMFWNVLCFDFISVRMYALLLYIVCFTECSVERVEECEAGEDGEGVFEEFQEAVDDSTPPGAGTEDVE